MNFRVLKVQALSAMLEMLFGPKVNEEKAEKLDHNLKMYTLFH